MAYKFIDRRVGKQVCGFRCDCGRRDEAEFGPDDLKTLTCRCGATMYRDYSGIAITGDLPSKWTYHDQTLGVDITSKTHRQRVMESRGLVEYHRDQDMAPFMEEIDYTKKTRGKSVSERKAASRRIKEIEVAAGRKRDEIHTRKAFAEEDRKIEKALKNGEFNHA